MDGNGYYLGMEKGCFVLKDRKGNVEKYPLFENEIREVVLRSGNMVSTGALASLGFWDVDVMITTARGRPVAMLKSMDDDSHVKTRLCQYEAVHSEKGMEIAKQLVLGKIKGQNILLEKYGLEPHDIGTNTDRINGFHAKNLDSLRKKLLKVEGDCMKRYFRQIFPLIPEKLRPETRKKFKAYDGVNNMFNLGYEVLQWKVHRALLKAKLEPYLGFLHSVQFGKPSLVCDMQELYRYFVDDYVIQFCQGLKKKDFTTKAEDASKSRKGRREYLKDNITNEMMRGLKDHFETKVEVPLIRQGKRQRRETLINEEALLLAKFLRNDMKAWIPRIYLTTNNF